MHAASANLRFCNLIDHICRSTQPLESGLVHIELVTQHVRKHEMYTNCDLNHCEEAFNIQQLYEESEMFLGHPIASYSYISSHDTCESELDFATDDDILKAVRRLAAKSITEAKGRLQLMQQAAGFTHVKFDPPYASLAPTCSWDTRSRLIVI